jgi:hypothetical protein
MAGLYQPLHLNKSMSQFVASGLNLITCSLLESITSLDPTGILAESLTHCGLYRGLKCSVLN